jgi:hypothetical protein
MTAFEIKLARRLAASDEDLSRYNDDVLFGCACSDFVHPVNVSLGTVAKLMRWQYVCFDGSWDENLWNEELWVYKRRIRIDDMNTGEVQTYLRDGVLAALRGNA